MELATQIFQFILSISILVILHELGHFLPAKWFKCRVDKFYLFFEYQVEEKIAIKKLEAHEISETIWVKISELNLEEIAFDSQRKFLENYQ